MKYLLIVLLVLTNIYGESTFENTKTQYFKSYDYEQMNKYEEAIKVLAPLYKRYPNNYTLNLRFGWLFYLSKNYQSAIEYYKKASLANTYAIAPKLGLANIYLTTQNYDDVVTTSSEILKTDYYNFYANLYMVKALVAQGKYDVAQSVINKILIIYPTNIAFLEQLAIVYKITNNASLDSLYKDILILDPNNILVRSNVN